MTLTLSMDIRRTEVGEVLEDPYKMEEEDLDLESEHQDSIEQMLVQFNNNTLNSSWQVLNEHKAYLSSFLKAHSLLLRGDGPLPAPVRHFVAIMAASRHSCSPLVANHQSELLAAGGPPSWLEQGMPDVTTKIQRLGEINRILAHQPWTLTPSHIEEITRSGTPGNWSLSELVYAIVLMAHFHAFSSFIESCVTMEDGTKKKSTLLPGSTTIPTQLPGSPTIQAQLPGSPTISTQLPGSPTISTQLPSSPSEPRQLPRPHYETQMSGSPKNPTRPHDCSRQWASESAMAGRVGPVPLVNSWRRVEGSTLQEFSTSPPYDCTAQLQIGPGSRTAKDHLTAKLSAGSPESDRVDSLVQKMKQLRSKPEADSEELEAMFKKVERTSAEISRLDEMNGPPCPNAEFRKYLIGPEFQYVDFAQRDNKLNFPTFRIQDYNWDEEGFSVISRFYDDIAQLLDDKFKTAYNLTYGTMGRLSAVDTSMFRRATWNYIQCLYGVRWDDYDYSEVNDLLHRSLKKYIKTAACYPDRCSIEEYQAIMTDFQPSEKIHVCLLVAEAKFQSELLYAMRAVATHFRS